jgi:hypothetical protein
VAGRRKREGWLQLQIIQTGVVPYYRSPRPSSLDFAPLSSILRFIFSFEPRNTITLAPSESPAAAPQQIVASPAAPPSSAKPDRHHVFPLHLRGAQYAWLLPRQELANGIAAFTNPLKGYENRVVQCQNCGNMSGRLVSRW